MRQTLATAVLLTFAVATAQTAGAGEAAAAEREPETPVTPFIDSGNTLPDSAARQPSTLGKWYGWQILAADLSAVGCIAAFEHPICAVPLLFTGPVTHLAHGRPGLAGVSVALRLGGTALGAGIGHSVANCPARSSPQQQSQGDGTTLTIDWSGLDSLCEAGYTGMGAVIGMAAAVVVDAAIGFDRVTPRRGSDAGARSAPAIAPQVSIGQNRVGLGLGGAF